MELCAGLDVHSTFTYATFVDEKGNSMGKAKVPTTESGFLALCAPRKHHKVKAVFEASRNWSRVRDLLHNAEVYDVVLAHPRKLRAIASVRIKTDRIDSRDTR